MSKIANKQMICAALMEAAKADKDIVALCSDSRGSGSFTPLLIPIRSSLWKQGLQSRTW